MLLTLLLWLIGIAYFLLCLWLVLVVLLQEGKSGGMAGMDNNQAPGMLTDSLGAGGAQKSLFSMTAWSAAFFFVLAGALTILGNYQQHDQSLLDLGDREERPAATVPVTGTGTDEGEEELLPEEATTIPIEDVVTDPLDMDDSVPVEE